MAKLTHIDSKGNARMVDISEKRRRTVRQRLPEG